MKSKKVGRWLVQSIRPLTKNQQLIGIYNTRKEAKFILSKVNQNNQRTGYKYIVKETNKPLFPSTSYKVGNYLSTLSDK